MHADRASDSDRLGGLSPAAFQQAPKVRAENPDGANGGQPDYNPNVSGLSVLVLDNSFATVMGGVPGSETLPGGVEGQQLTIVGNGNEVAIFFSLPDLKLKEGGTWSGEKGDTLSLVRAGGVWYETGRSKNH